MADLLTQLDVIAWDVCPEHKEVYFAIYSFPSIRTSRYTQGLQITLCYVLT